MTDDSAATDQSTQEPVELQVDTADREAGTPGGPGLTDRQRAVLFRLVRVAYPHDRFPNGPYQRTAEAVENAADADGLAALQAGLDALDDAGFVDQDDATGTKTLEAIDTQPFFQQIHATTVVALYDDREVWDLLGYEGSAFEKGGYVDRGFDDLDWLPEPRVTEYEGERVEIATGEKS